MTGTPSGAHRRPSTAAPAGRNDTRLVVIRGNSASGKSSVAQGLRDHYGRGIAIVGQDVIRRNVLREHDTARGANIALLGRIAREALNAGFHVVLEGILYADRYGHMITSLVRDHRGISSCYYLDVPLEATLVRHTSKADAAYLAQVTDSHLASWYRELDLLPGSLETVIPADSTLQDTTTRILRETDLASASPIPPPQCEPSQTDAMNSPVLMSDPRVAAIPLRECREPLVDVRDHDFRVDPVSKIRWARSPTSARASWPGWNSPAPIAAVLLTAACGSGAVNDTSAPTRTASKLPTNHRASAAAPARSSSPAAKAKTTPSASAKACPTVGDVIVWMRVASIPDSAQLPGGNGYPHCESTIATVQQTSPNVAGSCTEAAWASDNPGYDADTTPARRLKEMQVSVGPAC
ncbi:AAA family ATPase [Streptomyces sp. NPDC005236]|uniref:AAA family ATPase n=1 Tax=Streptomyces sp. NPDC005236 TaxID=3157028 RepID=UPI0033B731BB